MIDSIQKEKIDIVKKFSILFKKEEDAIKSSLINYEKKIKEELLKIYYSKEELENNIQSQLEGILNKIHIMTFLYLEKVMEIQTDLSSENFKEVVTNSLSRLKKMLISLSNIKEEILN